MKASFRQKIADFITTHPDELLTFEQFMRVVKTWKKDNMSPEAAYYFNDTELRTSRSDAPLSVSLRVGVRLLF